MFNSRSIKSNNRYTVIPNLCIQKLYRATQYMYASLFIQHAIFGKVYFNKTGPAHGGGAGIAQSVYPLCYGPESGFRKRAGSGCFPFF